MNFGIDMCYVTEKTALSIIIIVTDIIVINVITITKMIVSTTHDSACGK